MKLSKLRPTVFERAAERVLKASEKNAAWGERFACMALDKASDWHKCPERQAFEYFFGPKDKDGKLLSRCWFGSYRNLKYAPRPVRAHPFWDKDSAKPELQALRASALLTMAAMVRSAKENKAYDQEF